MNSSGGFFTHHEALLCALSVTHARITCVQSRAYIVYGRNAENEPVSRIKMADYRKYGNALAIFETKPLHEKRQI